MSRTQTKACRLSAVPSTSLRAGFTLTELLVATAITLIFGALAVATLRYGSALWRDAHRRGYAYDLASFIFHQVQDDLGAARPQYWSNDPTAFDTRVRFYLDRDRYYELNYLHPGPDPAVGRDRLRFVKGISEETPNQRLRQAGDGLDDDGDGLVDEQYYNLKEDPIDTNANGDVDTFDTDIDQDLLPLEGTCEVAYLMGLDGTAATGDAHTLYRGVLSPIGETTPLPLDPAFAAAWPEYGGFNVTLFNGYFLGDDPTDTPALAAARVQAKAVPMAEDVLYFEVRCWTQYTTTWEPWLPAPVPAWVGFSSLTWDSDRLAVDPFDPLNPARTGPVFFMDWSLPPPLPAPQLPDDDGDGVTNGADLNYVRDNVFPRAIMVVVVADPSRVYPQPRPLSLGPGGVAAGATSIPVTGNMPSLNEAWPYLLIEDPDSGDEWVRFTAYDPTTNEFMVYDDPATPQIDGRGARGTLDVGHGATQSSGGPTRVKIGHTFSRVFYNPALREQ